MVLQTSRETMVPHSSKCETPLLGAQCDSEEQSDVVFLVCGAAGERWRVPGHRRVLAAASPVFAAMLQGPLAEGREVLIRDVERRAFDLLLRHVYGEVVQLQSVDTALATLYAAHKYQCEALETYCLAFLSTHIDTNTVLIILHCIRVYCNLLATPTGSPVSEAPSAPSLDVIESTEEDELVSKNSACHLNAYSSQKDCKYAVSDTTWRSNDHLRSETTHCDRKVPSQNKENQSEMSVCDISQNYRHLMKRCLRYIDSNADKVLQEELIDELSKEELLYIIQRDTLCLSSEVVLLKALEQWSKSVCKRNCWELSSSNLRKALGNELLFSVRYLLMTSEEFMNFAMASKLLSNEECNYLLAHILKHNVIPNSSFLEDILPTLRKRRQTFCSKNMATSHYSDTNKEMISINLPGKSSESNSKSKKLFKKKRDQCRKQEVRLQERKPNMSDYFFSCIACIFD